MPHAEHGGQSFSTIGVDFSNLERLADVVSADVLDAWFDPSPLAIEAIRNYLPELARSSPPIHAEGLRKVIGEVRCLQPASILTGNGSSSLIFAFIPKLLGSGDKCVVLEPTYAEYEHVAGALCGAEVLKFKLGAGNDFEVDTAELAKFTAQSGVKALFLVNPNSPTGSMISSNDMAGLMASVPSGVTVWVDETYVDYAEAEGKACSVEALTSDYPNLIVVKSLSKSYALSGLRVGYLVAHPSRIQQWEASEAPWSVGLLGQVGAVFALRDAEYYRSKWLETINLRKVLSEILSASIGKPIRSYANFLLVASGNAPEIAVRLRETDIFVREFSTASTLSGRYLRFAVRSPLEIAKMKEALEPLNLS